MPLSTVCAWLKWAGVGRLSQLQTPREWAYSQLYRDSAGRVALLPAWLSYCNYTRPHGSLGRKPPGTRLGEPNNVARNYT